jgi:ribosomal protein S18 acetylase RimI-like enzyme
MLELAQGLKPAQLDAIAELEERVVRHDGGRLKLEWGALRNRSPERVTDVLWWSGDRLLGFLGIYQFGSSTPELAGMVDPEARHQGIGSALLDWALPRVRERGCNRALLVTLDDNVIGTIRLSQDGSRSGLYGFAIDSSRRGEGIGAEVLCRVCQQLFDDGAMAINLEVAVENERALGLYRRLGFEPITTEDYYALAL